MNTGVQRMVRGLFAALERRTQVTPLLWSPRLNAYCRLSTGELQFLAQPFAHHPEASARPEALSTPFPWSKAARYLRHRRRRFVFDPAATREDVLLVPEIFQDNRVRKLPALKTTFPGRRHAVFPDAIAVMASDALLMPALMTQLDIKSYDDLRGQTLSVDAALTGLALILYALLEKGGLKPGDYQIVRTGGVLGRFEGLKRHEFAGALFNTPFSTQLEELGYRSLDTAASVMQHYQGHVVATRAGWAQ
jgi:hypothetical protein